MNNKSLKFRWFMWEGVAGSSWFMWIVSSFLSYWGLTHLAPNLPAWMKYIALGFSVVINFVEFMIDQKGWRELWHPKTFGDVVLRLFGLACYGYDILTNVLGFLAIVFASYGITQIEQAWKIDPALTILALTFGFCFAAGPEPVYLEYLQNRLPYPGLHPLKQLGRAVSNRIQPVPAYHPKPQQTPLANPSNEEAWKKYIERHPEKFKPINKNG